MKTYIHLKPALQEYLKYAILKDSEIIAKGFFGKLIKPWLSIPPKDYNPLIPKDDINIFVFELPLYNDKNTLYNYYISPVGEKYISNVLNSMFMNQLYLYLDTMIEKGYEIKQSIYDFCYSYNIPMDYINYETLKKSYYRHKLKKK